MANIESVRRCPVELKIILARLQLPVGVLASLEEGESIEIERTPHEPVTLVLMVNERPFAWARLEARDPEYLAILTRQANLKETLAVCQKWHRNKPSAEAD